MNPPSDKQIAILQKYQADIPATKEEATAVIGKLFGEQDKKANGNGNKPEPVQVLPERSESERTEECSHMIEILWDMAEKKSRNIIANYTSADGKDQIILAEVLYKGLVECWNR